MADTVRERIVAELIHKFEAMVSPQTVWSIIQRSELEESKLGMYSRMLSVSDTEEEFNYVAGFIEPMLRVELEFWYRMREGDVASRELNIMLGDLKQVVFNNTNMVEAITDSVLTLNMQITESSMDIEGPSDDLVSGYLSLEILYRHKSDDPTALR